MITFTANIRSASAHSDDSITTSSVGIPVQLVLADEFTGLAKTLVFRAGETTVDVVLVGDSTEAVVPPDVLTTVGLWLQIGVYAADGNGNIVIPTVWASAGLVQKGTLPSGVDPSAPTPSWVAQVQSIASEANENAADAITIAQGVKAQADAGDFNGTDGTDGFSPVVIVTDIEGGHRVSITDANGTHTFDVMNGENGTDGTDGYSPTVTVTEITGGHRVTITDVNGDHTFDVMDGTGGGGSVDSVNGKTGDVVLDASDVGALPDTTTIPSKTSQLQNDSGFITSVPVTSVNNKTGAVVLNASDVGAGTYSKPSGGIPKSDLASAVQTSLGKADTALQSAPVTSVNSKTGAVTLGKSDVGLGNVDNVQQYSATNPPPYPVTSVNGSTGAVTLSIPSSASDVGAVAVAQGVGHSGEFLVVGSDGNVTTVTMQTWQGGAY